MDKKVTIQAKEWAYFVALHNALKREVTNESRAFNVDVLILKNRELEARLMRTRGGAQRVAEARKMAGLPVCHEFEISFCVQGYVTQQVEITDLKLTEKNLRDGLASGKYATTIQEGGEVIVVRTGKFIGRVVNVDNNAEYDDFDVENQSL